VAALTGYLIAWAGSVPIESGMIVTAVAYLVLLLPAAVLRWYVVTR